MNKNLIIPKNIFLQNFVDLVIPIKLSVSQELIFVLILFEVLSNKSFKSHHSQNINANSPVEIPFLSHEFLGSVGF